MQISKLRDQPRKGKCQLWEWTAVLLWADTNNGYQGGGGVTSGSAYIGGNNQGALIYTNQQPNGAQQPQSVKPPGRIDDYDPMNGQWGSATSQKLPFNTQQQLPAQQPLAAAPAPVAVLPQPSAPVQPVVAKTVAPVTTPTGPSFRAIYDYTAADVDEVTFVEGDLIVNAKSVDEGWMTGTVQRTSQWGMLPANYVERA